MKSTPWLDERFDGSALDPRLRWMNAPPIWRVDPSHNLLHVAPAGGTDFWRKTHYGFEADNGHFLYAEVSGDFVLSTQVRFQPLHQYDQAGLMLRISPDCWLKTSVEYEPGGPNRLGAVVTNLGYSDWSTQDFAAERNELALRIRREGDDCIVECAAETPFDRWSQLRVAHLHESRGGDIVQGGLYACSPKGAGFTAEFGHLTIELRSPAGPGSDLAAPGASADDSFLTPFPTWAR